MNLRTLFSSTYLTWNTLAAHYQTPGVKITDESNKWIRKTAPIVNVAKKALLIVAFAITTIATGLFSLFILPYRIYQLKNANQLVAADLALLTSSQRAELRLQIVNCIREKEKKHNFRLTSEQYEEFLRDIMAYYARSSEFYGPVALAWTECLLEKANKDNRKLVFCARDGIAPYEIALKLMQRPDYQQKYPNLVGEEKIVLAYLSRAVVTESNRTAENKETFHKYLNQLGIRDGDQCTFVDIGFQGSQINNTRSILKFNNHNIDASFSYLLSHTDDAEGFIISEDDSRRTEQEAFKQLPSIMSILYKRAGSNLATHWLEDTHQKNVKSPSRLVKVEENGKIKVYPNTLVPGAKEFVASKGSKEYFIRKWCLKAVVQGAEKYDIATLNLSFAVNRLDEMLDKVVKGQLPLLVSHR